MVNLASIYQLSTDDFMSLLNEPLSAAAPIQLKADLDEDVLNQIPFLCSAEQLLTLIASESKGLKLTPSGALPVKYVKAIYDNSLYKDPLIESGMMKLNREDASTYIGTLHFILRQSPYIKCVHNTLSLTSAGKKHLLAPNRSELLRNLLLTFINKYQLSSVDGYNESMLLQRSAIWSIYMFLIHGDTRLPVEYLTELLFVSFPDELDLFQPEMKYSEFENSLQIASRAYGLRVFERFLAYFGWVDYSRDVSYGENKHIASVKSTALLKSCFTIGARKTVPTELLKRLELH